MNLFTFKFSSWDIIIISLIVAFGVLIVPILLRLIPLTIKKQKRKAMRIGAFLQRLYWLLVILYVMIKLIQIQPVYGVLTNLLICFSTWSFIRNFFAGMILYFSDEYKSGGLVLLLENSGTIETIGVFYTALKQDNNTLIYVANSQISKSIVSRQISIKERNVIEFNIQFPKGGAVTELSAKLRKTLLSNPWVDASEPIKIDLKNNLEETIEFKVVLYGGNSEQLTHVPEMTKSAMRTN